MRTEEKKKSCKDEKENLSRKRRVLGGGERDE